MMDALGALHARWGLRELVVASYQAASGAGQAGVDRLYDELEVVAADRSLGQASGDVRRAVSNKLGDVSPFPAPLALNVIPMAGSVGADGWSSEERKVRNESRKILGIADLKVSATCVRVPVVTTHSLAVHAVFEQHIDVDLARQTLIEAPSVVVVDDPVGGEFPTPADAVGADPTFVGPAASVRSTSPMPWSSSSAVTTCARARRSTPHSSPNWSPGPSDRRPSSPVGSRDGCAAQLVWSVGRIRISFMETRRGRLTM